MAKRPLNETEEVENGVNEEKGGKGRVRLVVKFSSDQSKEVSSSSSSLSSQSRVCCQVSDCGQDLGEVKVYYRKHKVCEYHAKAAVVSINGIDRRFCQQCSRFHEISEFDDTKRSCRKRLAGHNERRRKHCVDLPAEEKAVHIPSVPDVKDKSWKVRGHLEHAEEKAVHIPSLPDVKDKSWKVRGHLEHLTTRVQGKPSYMQFL